MINIKDYIVEKLYIGKGYKAGHDFKEGDEFAYLTLYFNNEFDKKVELTIHEPFRVTSVNDNKVTYLVNQTGKEITRDYYVNSKGYWEIDDDDVRGKKDRCYNIEVLLTPKELREILELSLKEKIFNPKYKETAKAKLIDLFVKQYFDMKESNIKELKEKEIVYYDLTGKFGTAPIDRPKELKELIAKYY